MPLADDSDWKRREKRKRRYQLHELPQKHNAALLEGMDQERGVGRVLRDLMTASQGNFDHFNSEMKRFAKLYNEGEEDTYYLKELLDPHEHPSRAPTSEDISGLNFRYKNYAPGQWSGYGYNEDNFPDNSGMEVPVNLVRCTPFWIGRNRVVDQFRLMVATTTQIIYPDFITTYQHENEYTLHVALYAGDNPANMPGTLLEYLGDAMVGEGNDILTFNFDQHHTLSGGSWYWGATMLVPNPGASAWVPQIEGVTNESDDIFNTSQSHWWPFHELEGGLREGILSYDYPRADHPDFFPEFLETDDATYALWTPAIEMRSV